MTNQEIKTAYERDGYVVLKDIIDLLCSPAVDSVKGKK